MVSIPHVTCDHTWDICIQGLVALHRLTCTYGADKACNYRVVSDIYGYGMVYCLIIVTYTLYTLHDILTGYNAQDII